MKKNSKFENILLLFVIAIVVYRFAYIVAEKGAQQSVVTITTADHGFLNYVLLRPWVDTIPYWHITNHIVSFKELNYNAAHHYGGDGTYLGGYGQNNLTQQQLDTLSRIVNLSSDNGLTCILDRQRTSVPCLSQRLIYEAEGGNYGFSYQNRTGNIEQDDGRTVIHACRNVIECPGTDATPRMFCDNIYENLQHTDLYYFHPDSSDIKPWILKPVMRIDSSIFSPSNDTEVVAIITKNYVGKTIDSTVIRVNNFAQSNYTGKYDTTYFGVNLKILGNHLDSGLNYGRPGPGKDIKSCKVDFKVYWYGLVDVWFDKMIVDDTRADEVFSPNPSINFDGRIEDELEIFGDTIIFFVGEITSSQAYTVKHVRDKMRQINPAVKLQFAVSNNINLYSHRNTSLGCKFLFDVVEPDMICLDAHTFQVDSAYKIYLPDNASGYCDSIPDSWIASPYTYNQRLQTNAFGNKSDIVTPYQGTFIYQITKIRTDLRQLSPNSKFVVQPHLHSWAKTINNMFEDGGFREPTNEEIQAQATIAIAHGAQSLNWESYHSDGSNNINLNSSGRSDTIYTILGLRNQDSTKRTSNSIHQNKWEYVKAMNLKILQWKPTLDKLKWHSGYSVHYEGADHNIISDIKSIIVHSTPPTACEEDYINYDCQEDRYWEMGFFDPDFDNPTVDQYDKSKYFIMVNRRCVPEIDSNGDLRQLKIKFNTSQLSGFRNWNIIEMDSNNVVRTFDKDSNIYVDMGVYQPGEGRLYKIAPVMQEGGTLVADEECGEDIECKSEVNNNGKNIFLKPGTNISFADHTARIKMTGGVFKSGYSQTQNSPVYLKGKDNSSWKGILLYGCDSVLIKDTHFSNISPYPVDSTYAVDMINCKFINIETGSFISEGDINAGCIRSGYVTNEDIDYSACIQGNSFETDEGEIPALSFIATAGLSFPLIINGNTFTTASSNSSSNAILLNNIIGGVIKNNTISEYINSIILLSSSMDLYNNTITSGIDNAAGIQLYSFSTAFLKPSGMYYTGGYNNFTNLGDGSRNIELLTSYFNMYKGYNVFNVESNSDYHLIGSLYLSDLTSPTQNAKLNCFQFDGTNTPENQALVWDYTGMPAAYIFTPYSCEIEEPIAYEVINIGNRINDTIYYEESGTGGGKSNYELGIKNYELQAKAGKDESRINNIEEYTEITSLESFSDSIGINIRRRNYERVSEDCMNILTNYPDSLESIGIISKLYLADLRLDSAGNKITGLKTFLESLILNHSNNTALVKQAFYYIQKCKVSLKQYESAMTGFLEIMDENPYSYEGLVASWDFSATSLLFEGGGGAGGGISNYKLQISNDGSRDDEIEISDDDKSQIRNSKSQILKDGSKENERENDYEVKSQIRNSKSQILNDDPNDKYDKKTFTGEDRKIIRENVFNIFETSKEIETEKVSSLEKKFEEGKASKEERAELEKKKTLSETIKARKPADAFEHIKFVNNDIQKVFGVSGRGSEKRKDNIIPEEYSLSQNYPNPFNPITHLEFGISNLGFVSLKVYDVLGREIKTLVNEIKPAGSYRVEFDGSNFASGVYFYRLEAGDFVQTKRMVLIK